MEAWYCQGEKITRRHAKCQLVIPREDSNHRPTDPYFSFNHRCKEYLVNSRKLASSWWRKNVKFTIFAKKALIFILNSPIRNFIWTHETLVSTILFWSLNFRCINSADNVSPARIPNHDDEKLHLLLEVAPAGTTTLSCSARTYLYFPITIVRGPLCLFSE